MTEDQRYQQFQEQGYTVFERVFERDWMEQCKAKIDDLHGEAVNWPSRPAWWFGNMLEYAPRLMLPAVSNSTLLDFAQRVMGPFVQLDNVTLAAFPPVAPDVAAGGVSGWHRDRWGEVPRGTDYQRPHAINAISYLQDLTPEYGPLRVVPGSHRRAVEIAPAERAKPHRDEQVLQLKAGDVALTHGNLIHSGTPNTSGKMRYFFSIFFNLSWLRHTDNFAGPNITELKNQARAAGDLRLLRLMGEDEQLENARQFLFFLDDDEAQWARWCEQDRLAFGANGNP